MVTSWLQRDLPGHVIVRFPRSEVALDREKTYRVTFEEIPDGTLPA
jgi:hypothetical protein